MMSVFGIPDTVKERAAAPTGKWEVYHVWDSNWDKAVPAVFNPDGVLDHVYSGYPEGEWLADQYVEHKNYGPPQDE
jgi:hypothetical protein